MKYCGVNALIGIAGVLGFASVWGQSGAGPELLLEPNDAPPIYVDRLIDATTLPSAEADDNLPDYDASGWPRVLRVEARASITARGSERRQESGLVVNARIDTPHYGAWALDGALRVKPDHDDLFTISQRGMPFAGGWFANNSVGILNTPAIDLTRTQSRFFLPSFGLAGIATEWLRGPGLQLHASAGRRGRFQSYSAPGFEERDQQIVTGGAQWSPAPGWQTGVQFADGRNRNGAMPDAMADAVANPAPSPLDPHPRSEQDAGRSWFGAGSWLGAASRLQVNVAHSSRAGQRAAGVWLDGQTRQSRTTHHYGVFNLEPGLSWGSVLLNNDIRGGYYRLAHHARQWHVDAGIDQVSSVSGRGSNGVQLNGSARYLISQTYSAGAGAFLRSAPLDAWSTFSFLERRGDYGHSRMQFDLASDDLRRKQQLSFDHAWRMPIGSRLATGVSLGRESTAAGHHNSVAFAVTGGGEIGNRTTLDASLRVHTAEGDGRRSGTQAGFGLTRRLGAQWFLTGSYHEQRGKERLPIGLNSLIPVPTVIEMPAHRALFVVLRHESRAGVGQAPLGGRPGSAAGAIQGYLYLDANENGMRDAGEGPAAQVTVLLDGKFPVRTDAQGRFEFPMVVSGQHTVTVIPDNLPLPWTLADPGRREVTVPVRDTVTLEIPAIRIK